MLRLHPAVVLVRRQAVEARLLEAIKGAALRQLLRPSVAKGHPLGRGERDALVRHVFRGVEVDDVILQVEASEDLLLVVREARGPNRTDGVRGTPSEQSDEGEAGESEAEHHRKRVQRACDYNLDIGSAAAPVDAANAMRRPLMTPVDGCAAA